ncbi:MAG: hypothetical protein LBG49_03085 [Mycoplasmataceae bacterium]|nr:hypothetical protein [Mycoplasmataceae bacterium]
MTSQTENMNNTKQQTKKKKLLFILIPLSLIIVALALFLGFWYGCKSNTPP